MEHDSSLEELCRFLKSDSSSVDDEENRRYGKTNWDEVSRLAYNHGVFPLFYQRLQTRSCSADIPAHIMAALKERYLLNAARNLAIFYHLQKALSALKRKQIRVIVLKGAFLAEEVYSNISLRQMNDVDLLVMREDLASAQECLVEAGYGISNPHIDIDMHWNIDLSISKLPIDMHGIWQKARPAVIAAEPVLGLCPEDLIIHLCTHLSFHHVFQEHGLRAMCDIQATVDRYDSYTDWKELTCRAKQWRAGTAVYLSLDLARELLDVPIPSRVLETLEPKTQEPHLKSWAIAQMRNLQADYSTALSPLFWELWNRSHDVREKISLLRRLVLPSPEFVSQKFPASYGSPQNYLHYWTRLKKRLGPYIITVWGIGVGDETQRNRLAFQQQVNAMRQWLMGPGRK